MRALLCPWRAIIEDVENREASDLSKRVATELKAAQIRGGWTWTQIEEATGIPHTTMQRMLNGKADIPVAKLMLICQAAGIQATAIIDEATRHMPDDYLASLLVSPAPANVTNIRGTDWDAYQGRKAADNDEEAWHDEPDTV